MLLSISTPSGADEDLLPQLRHTEFYPNFWRPVPLEEMVIGIIITLEEKDCLDSWGPHPGYRTEQYDCVLRDTIIGA